MQIPIRDILTVFEFDALRGQRHNPPPEASGGSTWTLGISSIAATGYKDWRTKLTVAGGKSTGALLLTKAVADIAEKTDGGKPQEDINDRDRNGDPQGEHDQHQVHQGYVQNNASFRLPL